MNQKRQTFLNFSLTRSAYVRIIRKGAGEKSRPKGVATSSEACGRCDENGNCKKEGDKMTIQSLIPFDYLHALHELHGEFCKTNPIFPFFNQKRTFAKRTHFQSSRSIPASDKSLCRLSAFLAFTFYPLLFTFLSKRTHFDNTIRYANAINSELFAKRTHFRWSLESILQIEQDCGQDACGGDA
jgi:hypothetical protein